jgi:folate-binding protein YgfZ
MQAQRTKYVDGAVARVINEKKATQIFDLMEHFAGYGFNKSHSTAYALLAYQTAYLKANYPWHFAAALLTIEAQNTDKLAVYLQECRDRSIPVLPPDINKSQLAFTVTPEGVRFGLTAVKNVGEGAIASILGVRASQGRITSLHALCDELDLRLVNKRVLGEVNVQIVRIEPLAGDAYAVLAPDAVALRRMLAGHGTQLDEPAITALRVAAAIPAYPNEINERFNPWEARLAPFISLTKGCYIGQEVVARLNTYEKVQRKLSVLALERAFQEGDVLYADDGSEAGVVTTVAGDRALGYVAVAHLTPGTLLRDATVLEHPAGHHIG